MDLHHNTSPKDRSNEGGGSLQEEGDDLVGFAHRFEKIMLSYCSWKPLTTARLSSRCFRFIF